MVANLINPISGLGEDEQCLKIINLNYVHLPACLKPCFLYLGISPEDEWIYASKLLQFWVAEGFVRGKKGVSLEEAAEDYLKDLVDRNLILIRERRWNGNVEYFVIHDIVRELCLKIAEQEKFLGVLSTTEVISTGWEHRIVVPRESSFQRQQTVVALQLPPLLHSLICQEACFIDELSVDLRLLRLSAYGSVFPTPNYNQVNLRYLDILRGDWYPIPSSMFLFWNIQTLIITHAMSVPYEIWEMKQLRHLEFVVANLVVDPLPGVINDQSNQQKCIVLENLHTLLRVENLRFTEVVCKRMPNIKNLSLYYNDFSGDCQASSSYNCPHNLGRLNKLESLDCEFGDDYKLVA